jgi:hypothetical protein
MESIPRKPTYLIPAMALIEETVDKEANRDVIEFLVKQQAGSAATAPSYKRRVQDLTKGQLKAGSTSEKGFQSYEDRTPSQFCN